MTIGFATFVRLYQGATTYARWQNFWPSHSPDSFSFAVFEIGSMESSISGSDVSTSISFGYTASIRSTLMTAADNAYLVEISLYSFTPTADGSPPVSKTLLAQHIGQAMNVADNGASLDLSVGDALSPSRPQVPPRVYTTALVGVPCQL